ncbi:MAG: response regulator [Anaerolineales bacterium]
MKPNHRILVVDDDPDVVVLVGDVLKHMGYQVSTARNGVEGLEKAKKEIPDLIILDVMMPEMDGYEVCSRLRADPKTRILPILMLTAKGYLRDKVKGLDTGADDYLPKPYEKDELESRVKVLLRRGAAINKRAAESSIRLFLSYARDDGALVEKIYRTLSNQGYKPWMDVHDITGGEEWEYAIKNAIKCCELFIPILTNNSVNRRGMLVEEIKQALDKWNKMLPGDIYIIPLRLDDCPIPELVERLQVIDWDGGKGKNKFFKAIETAIERRKQVEAG